MKKFLQNLISRKQKDIDTMRQRVKDSQDIDEVRSLGAQIEAAQAEIEEARAKLAECNTTLGGVRAEMDEENQDGEEGQDEDEGNDAPDNNARSRNFAPGRVVGSYDTRSNAPQQARAAEARAKAFAKSGRQNITATEARAVLVSGGKIATPTEVGGINDAFTQVSSIVDMVKVVDCTGMGAYKVAFIKSGPKATKHTEGSAAAESEPDQDFATITPEDASIVTYISRQVKKQSPLLYEAKTREQALLALRGYTETLIMTKIKASKQTKTIAASTITEKTLRNIALSYGGAKGVEGGATLALNKETLLAFGDVRGSQDKKAVYDITPGSDPNTGTIKDGGLTVPYCLVEDLAANELVYGKMHCFELGLFGDYEILASEDHAINKLMITIVGNVELGGEVTTHEGFIYAKASA